MNWGIYLQFGNFIPQLFKYKYYRKPFMPNLRKLLYPFSVLYHGVTEVRNKLYDAQFLKSESYDLPVITVGNLNMGGTGKSPMIEYLLKKLGRDNKLATLSRGYKRESKGFLLIDPSDSASKSGDEPLQFKSKFPDTIVAVDANRVEGINNLKNLSPDIILLDDAYQHRKVKAGFYILLTAYGDLYTDDLLLPAGNLRESSRGAKRADAIVVTKCPEHLTNAEMDSIRGKLRPKKNQDLFFSTIKYSENVVSEKEEIPLESVQSSEFVLVTGIADPSPLLDFLNDRDIKLKHYKFPDHHNFSEKEIANLKRESRILTTEKDYMRLKDKFSEGKIYYLPIEVKFLNHDEDLFDRRIQSYINKKEV